MHLLAHGGMLPLYQPLAGEQKISPRRKGVKQGALIFLLGVLLVPILAVFANFAPGRLSDVFGFFAILSALLCFVGGPLRMLFAALFEEGAPTRQFTAPSSYGPPAIPTISINTRWNWSRSRQRSSLPREGRRWNHCFR